MQTSVNVFDTLLQQAISENKSVYAPPTVHSWAREIGLNKGVKTVVRHLQIIASALPCDENDFINAEEAAQLCYYLHVRTLTPWSDGKGSKKKQSRKKRKVDNDA